MRQNVPEQLVARLGPAYIVWMMILTRLGGLIGGVAVVYYVRLALDLSGDLQYHFNIVAAVVVLLAVVATVLLALWETRTLRIVLRRLRLGHGIPDKMGREAGREAVVFAIRHHIREAFIVPMVCLPPVYVYLTFAAGAPPYVLHHITIATFIGVSSAVSLTYFVIERLMDPVVNHLIDYGVVIDYENLPMGRLQNRLMVMFTLIIVITAVMITTLANQKALQLPQSPSKLNAVVSSLRLQTLAISGCAVLMAVTLSSLLARSVTVRVRHMVEAMRSVEVGRLDERIKAIATDEIGMVGRSFNKMIAKLEANAAVIQELNANLERKVRDRTRELARSRQELQESYERLKEYDGLKTEFFSNISHELRTPLTLILAPVENLLENIAEPLRPVHRDALQIVRRNTVRLLNLINNLLDFAKLEAGKSTIVTSPVDLNEMIDDLVSSASLLAVDRGIRLTFAPDPQLPPCMLDRDKIEKVIVNLLSNALKFTGRGGSVDVESRGDGDSLIIRVADTGIGVAPKDQERIYERFVQVDGSTSRRYTGTGLGLPLVKEFVELHNGRITLQSELGSGSCFTVRIPLIAAEDAEIQQSARTTNYSEVLLPATRATAAPVTELGPDVETILVVDDSPDIVDVVRSLLASDYRILEAGDAETGLEMAVKYEPDIIISDVMMPGMDGYQFCQKIRTNPQTCRIGFIMLTAKADLDTKIEGLEHGSDEFLAKPFNPRELRARVRSLLKVRRLDRQLGKRNDELERAFEELKRAQSQLVQSEKMSSLGRLVAGIAHEINNAINAVYNGILPLKSELDQVRGVVEGVLPEKSALAVAAPAADEPVDLKSSFALMGQLVDVVEVGAKRTADIVSNLKKFAHPGRGDRAWFNVHEGIDVALNLLSSKMRNQVMVHRDYCDDAKILASGSELTQVVLNIIDNSRQAMSGSGNIWITTRREGDQLQIVIRDDGSGIPESVRDQIFDPFFTTKAVGVGTGLGLSISYGIIQGHGGSIDVQSPPLGATCGTEFTITLPVGAPVQTECVMS